MLVCPMATEGVRVPVSLGVETVGHQQYARLAQLLENNDFLRAAV